MWTAGMDCVYDEGGGGGVAVNEATTSTQGWLEEMTPLSKLRRTTLVVVDQEAAGEPDRRRPCAHRRTYSTYNMVDSPSDDGACYAHAGTRFLAGRKK